MESQRSLPCQQVIVANYLQLLYSLYLYYLSAGSYSGCADGEPALPALPAGDGCKLPAGGKAQVKKNSNSPYGMLSIKSVS